MARGKLLRTKLAEESKKSAGLMLAAEHAKAKILKEKNLGTWLREFADSLLHKIEVEDFFKYAAIISGAILIKTGIEWTEALTVSTVKLVGGLMAAPPLRTAFEQVFPEDIGLKFLRGGFKVEEAGKGLTQIGVDTEKMMSSFQVEILEWVMSFGLSYLIVNNFGTIVQTTGKALDMVSSAKMMLGMGLPVPPV